MERKGTDSLVGRKRVVDQLTETGPGVWLITGDSGVGKSALLEAAFQRLDPAVGQLHSIRFSESLVTALLGAIGDAASSSLDEDDLRVLVRRMASASASVANQYFSQLPSILFRQLLGVVQSRSGLPIGEFVQDTRTAMDEASGAAIAVQASEARGDVAAETVGGLIQSLAETWDGERPTLALDTRVELEKQDVRLLADVASRLPSNARIWLTLNTGSERGHSDAAWLCDQLPNVEEVEVQPLSLGAVREWLQAIGLNPRLARRIHRASDGYPLVIEEILANAELSEDAEIEAMASKDFGRLVCNSLMGLQDQTAREVVKKLALLRDPPPSSIASSLLELDGRRLADIRFVLEGKRLLTVSVNGQPWLHERRRQAVVEFAMDDAERRAYVDLLAGRIADLARNRSAALKLLLPLSLSAERIGDLCRWAAEAAPGDTEVWSVLVAVVRRAEVDQPTADGLLIDAMRAGAVNDAIVEAAIRRKNPKLRLETSRLALAKPDDLDPRYLRSCFLALKGNAESTAYDILESDEAAPMVKAAAIEAIPKRKAGVYAKRFVDSTDDPTLLIACFKILGRKATPRARRVLSDPRSHRDLIGPALAALEPSEARKFAASVIETTTDEGVATRCLQVLGRRAEKRARTLITDRRTPVSVAGAALDCLPQELRQREAVRLLDDRAEASLVCKCLEYAGADGARYGEAILTSPEQHESQVVAKALGLFGSSMPDAVAGLLVEISPPHVQARAIQILGEDAAPFARSRLERWREVPGHVLARCFQVAADTEEARSCAHEILSERDDSISESVLMSALRNAPDSDLRVALALEVLDAWRRRYRPLVTAAMMAFWSQPERVAGHCSDILGSWRAEISAQRRKPKIKRYEGHILKALSNPECETEAHRAAEEIVAAGNGGRDPVPKMLHEGARNFLVGAHLPWSRAFATPE